MENSIKSARKVQKVKLIFSKKKTKLCLQFYSSVRLIMSTFKLLNMQGFYFRFLVRASG